MKIMWVPVENVPRAIVKIIKPEVRNFDERGEYTVPRDYWELLHEHGHTVLRHLSGRYQYPLSPNQTVGFEETWLDSCRASIKQGMLHLNTQLIVEGDGLVTAI
jgi:hypothetical protein